MGALPLSRKCQKWLVWCPKYTDPENCVLICLQSCTYACTHKQTTNQQQEHRHTPCRTLRSASANLLSVTWCNLSFGTRGFRTAAPTIWNSLLANVRSSTTLNIPTAFKITPLSVQFPHCLATHLSTSEVLRPWRYTNLLTYLESNSIFFLQCFDTVGWMTGMASGMSKFLHQ